MRGDLEKATADYNRAIELDSFFAEAYFDRALVYVAQNNWDKALADYKQVIRFDPRTAEAYKEWGRAADKAGPQDGRPFRGDAPEGEARRRDAFPAGAARHKGGEFDKAIAEYDKALELYPRYTEVYYNRGLAYRKKDQLAKAIADYTQAIHLDPKYINAYANRGFAYYKLGAMQRRAGRFRQDPQTRSQQRRREEKPRSDREESSLGRIERFGAIKSVFFSRTSAARSGADDFENGAALIGFHLWLAARDRRHPGNRSSPATPAAC